MVILSSLRTLVSSFRHWQQIHYSLIHTNPPLSPYLSSFHSPSVHSFNAGARCYGNTILKHNIKTLSISSSLVHTSPLVSLLFWPLHCSTFLVHREPFPPTVLYTGPFNLLVDSCWFNVGSRASCSHSPLVHIAPPQHLQLRISLSICNKSNEVCSPSPLPPLCFSLAHSSPAASMMYTGPIVPLYPFDSQ